MSPGNQADPRARAAFAAYLFTNTFVSVALVAGASAAAHTVFIFPPLGATVFLLFLNPSALAASPRNTILGYAIAIACGYAALLVTGLAHAPPVAVAGVDLPRAVAAGLSIGLTSAAMVLARAQHPPGGATTLVVSLGIVTAPSGLAALFIGAVLVTLQASVAHRLARVPYPAWSASDG
jgi:CBS-domain-containing membrane protein